jgi:hypothetical protein
MKLSLFFNTVLFTGQIFCCFKEELLLDTGMLFLLLSAFLVCAKQLQLSMHNAAERIMGFMLRDIRFVWKRRHFTISM